MSEECLKGRLAPNQQRQAFRLERELSNGEAGEPMNRQFLQLLSELESAPLQYGAFRPGPPPD